jgi:DNA-binding transcriptional MerR regulator
VSQAEVSQAEVSQAEVSGVLLGIGEAATRLGVSERSLRYYQQIGLLTPSGRTPGGLRRYSEADLERVHRIRELQTLLGFNLDEIKAQLESEDRLAAVKAEYRDEATDPVRRRELLEQALAVRDQLRAVVEAKIAGLERVRDEIDGAIARIHELMGEPEPLSAGP